MSISPMRSLPATDGLEEAGLALRTAVDLTGCTGSELHVLTVGRDYRPAYEIPEYGELREKVIRTLEREAQGVLDG